MEIKYRAQGINSHKWFYGNYVRIEVDRQCLLPDKYYIINPAAGMAHCDCGADHFAGLVEVDRKTVGLYTGLKDKNGKETYHHELLRDDEGLLWEIEWGKGRFYLVSREKNIRPDGHITFVDEMESVGNRFENPELLEQEHD